MEYEKAKIVNKPDLSATLMAMPIGKPQAIPTSLAKAVVVRNSAARLRQQGYGFTVSEAGRTTDTIVTRIK